LFAVVGVGHERGDGVNAEPAQRFGFPSFGWAPHPGQRCPQGLVLQDEVGEGPSSQVGGRDSVADVATGPGDPGGANQTHAEVPVAWDAPVATPAVGDRDVTSDTMQPWAKRQSIRSAAASEPTATTERSSAVCIACTCCSLAERRNRR